MAATTPPAGNQALTNAMNTSNAFQLMYQELEQYGLGSMADQLLGYVQQGYDATTSTLLLQNSDAWKQRFAGNALRIKAGLSALDPATYLDLERQYDSTLRSFGIPAGMFGRSDFAQWIGGDVSPSEIQSRAQLAANAQYNADPQFTNALSSMFGIDKGHQIAYFLDSNRALPYLQNVAQATQIGAAALRQNLKADPNTALALASMGVTQSAAEQGYNEIASQLPTLQKLSAIQGQPTWGQTQGEQATLFQNAEAQRQRLSLVNNEEASFKASPGMGTNYLHPNYAVEPERQGSF